MTIHDNRNKSGLLTLDAVAFASQATNVRLEPTTEEDGEVLEVLSGEQITPDDKTTWKLVIVAVQDFNQPAGFVNFSLTNAGELVPFTWKPNASAPTYSGTVRVRPVVIGGEVPGRLSTTAEWPLDGAPTPTYPEP